jgi:hypothetical protein
MATEVPDASRSPELAARRARRGRLHALSTRLHLAMTVGPGPGTVAIYAWHRALSPAWQFEILLVLSVVLWAAFAASLVLVRRGREGAAIDLVFLSVWAFCGISLALRAGSLPTTTLAYVGILVLVFLLRPRRLRPAGVLVVATLAALRSLEHLGVLPLAVPPPLPAVWFDVGLAIVVLPVMGFGLHFGMQVNRLPFEHLRRSTEEQARILQTVARVGPELHGMADSASRGATELAASAGQQAATTARIAGATAELEQLLAQSAEAASSAREMAEATRRSSALTAERLDAVERQLNGFVADLAAIVASVETLTERTAGTEGVIDRVDDVHATVKVLALNAGIEAARAGAAGRGIAVVASEMRSMIASTEAGVHEGRRLLGAVRDDAGAAIARARESARRLEAHLKELADARQLVRGIVDGFGETSRGIDTIARGGEDQRRQVELVARAMREQEVATAALNGLAADLAASVQQFATSQAELTSLLAGGEAGAGPPPARGATG